MNKRATALIFSLLTLIILGILGGALIFRSVSEKQVADKYIGSSQAFWLAEAGIEKARSQLSLDWFSRSPSGDVTFGKGTYSFVIYTTDNQGLTLPRNRLRIISTGISQGATRKIEVIVEDIPVVEQAVVAVTKVELKPGITVHGDVYVDGNAEVQAGANIVTIDDSVSPPNPNAYNADLYYTGTTATIDGTVEGNVINTTEEIPMPTVDFVNVQTNADFVLPGGTTLSGELTDGVYYITGDVTLDGATLNDGSIVSDGKIEIKNGFDHGGPPYGFPALANQSGTIEIAGEATVKGLVYCGDSGIELKTGSTMIVYGTVAAVSADAELKTDEGSLDVYFKAEYLPGSPGQEPPRIIYWKELQNIYPLE
ncbi:MAG: hypothetical protein JW734_08750 [Candidatus Omnitrophica bacterium]|nr:hypothetical protein [Candidatus Omnitrophota bacterium]